MKYGYIKVKVEEMRLKKESARISCVILQS